VVLNLYDKKKILSKIKPERDSELASTAAGLVAPLDKADSLIPHLVCREQHKTDGRDLTSLI
jgi:hypothetical protein